MGVARGNNKPATKTGRFVEVLPKRSDKPGDLLLAVSAHFSESQGGATALTSRVMAGEQATAIRLTVELSDPSGWNSCWINQWSSVFESASCTWMHCVPGRLVKMGGLDYRLDASLRKYVFHRYGPRTWHRNIGTCGSLSNELVDVLDSPLFVHQGGDPEYFRRRNFKTWSLRVGY